MNPVERWRELLEQLGDPAGDPGCGPRVSVRVPRGALPDAGGTRGRSGGAHPHHAPGARTPVRGWAGARRRVRRRRHVAPARRPRWRPGRRRRARGHARRVPGERPRGRRPRRSGARRLARGRGDDRSRGRRRGRARALQRRRHRTVRPSDRRRSAARRRLRAHGPTSAGLDERPLAPIPRCRASPPARRATTRTMPSARSGSTRGSSAGRHPLGAAGSLDEPTHSPWPDDASACPHPETRSSRRHSVLGSPSARRCGAWVHPARHSRRSGSIPSRGVGSSSPMRRSRPRDPRSSTVC